MKVWGQTKSRDHCTTKSGIIAQQFHTPAGLAPFEIWFTLVRTCPSNWHWLTMFEMGKLIYSDILFGILSGILWHSIWHSFWHNLTFCLAFFLAYTLAFCLAVFQALARAHETIYNVWARLSIVARHLFCSFISKYSRPRCSRGLCLVCWAPCTKKIFKQVRLYLSHFFAPHACPWCSMVLSKQQTMPWFHRKPKATFENQWF